MPRTEADRRASTFMSILGFVPSALLASFPWFVCGPRAGKGAGEEGEGEVVVGAVLITPTIPSSIPVVYLLLVPEPDICVRSEVLFECCMVSFLCWANLSRIARDS